MSSEEGGKSCGWVGGWVAAEVGLSMHSTCTRDSTIAPQPALKQGSLGRRSCSKPLAPGDAADLTDEMEEGWRTHCTPATNESN